MIGFKNVCLQIYAGINHILLNTFVDVSGGQIPYTADGHSGHQARVVDHMFSIRDIGVRLFVNFLLPEHFKEGIPDPECIPLVEPDLLYSFFLD